MPHLATRSSLRPAWWRWGRPSPSCACASCARARLLGLFVAQPLGVCPSSASGTERREGRRAGARGGRGQDASGGQEAAKPPLSPSSSGRPLPAVPLFRETHQSAPPYFALLLMKVCTCFHASADASLNSSYFRSKKLCGAPGYTCCSCL